MEKKQKIVILVFGIVLLALLIALCAVIVLHNRPVYGAFVPPSWEENAVLGMPVEPLPPSFGSMTVEEGFVIAMCATPSLRDNDLDLYFASPATNTVWLLVRLYDESGRLLGESGLLKPGEHLPTITLSDVPQGDIITANVFSYEPETYYSRGMANAELQWISAD